MVAQRKTHTGRQAIVYLVFLILTACTDHSAQTVVQLHFKQPQNIIQALENNLEERIDFHVVDNSIVFHAPEEEITNTLSLLKTLDKPPASYRLHLKKPNINRYSTSSKPSFIELIEDFTTTIPIEGLRYEFLVQRIGQNRSILKINTLKRKKEIAKHNFLLTHDKWRKLEELKLSKEIKLQMDR